MKRARRAIRSPFASAVLGGIVVGLFVWIAIAAGWIEGEEAATIPTPLTAPVAVRSEARNLVNEIYRRDGRGVAFIQAERPASPPSPFNPFGGPGGGGASTGSGFVIDEEGHVLTNSHVVDGAERIEVKLGASEQSHSAKVIGSDPATDLALLKVKAPADQLHPLALGDSSKVKVGDPVVAIGNPFGLDRTVTSGIVSALQRQIQAPNGFAISDVIQTDAAINPGNSGGPLIDTAGRVIGINSQIETGGGSRGNVGIGFAVPIDTAREVVEQLLENGKVKHAYIGIRGATITADLATALNLPVDRGVLVQDVARGGPAAKAGLRGGSTPATIEGVDVNLGGDIIVAVGGERLDSMDELINIVNDTDSGDKLELTVVGGGERRRVTVTLGDRPATAG